MLAGRLFSLLRVVSVPSPICIANKPDLNILMCLSQRATRTAMPNEVILDASDGLGGPTLRKRDLKNNAAIWLDLARLGFTRTDPPQAKLEQKQTKETNSTCLHQNPYR